MIDANLSWRSNFLATDSNMTSLAGKNNDGDNGDLGAAAGDAFQAHIRKIAAVQGKAISTSQTDEQTSLPPYIFIGRGGSRQDGAATADSSPTQTQNESPADDSGSSGTFEGLDRGSPTMNVALRLAARVSSDTSVNEAAPATDDEKDADVATVARLDAQSDGSVNGTPLPPGTLASNPQGHGLANVSDPVLKSPSPQIETENIVVTPDETKEVDSNKAKEDESSTEPSTSVPDRTFDASSDEQSLRSNQFIDDTSAPTSMGASKPQRDRKSENTDPEAESSRSPRPTTPAASAAPSQAEKADASNDVENSPAAGDPSKVPPGSRIQSEMAKSRFVSSYGVSNTLAESKISPAAAPAVPAAQNLRSAAPALSQNSPPQTAEPLDHKQTDDSGKGDLSATSAQASTLLPIGNAVTQGDENPQGFSRRKGDDKDAPVTPLAQAPRNRDKTASATGGSSFLTTGSMAQALSLSMAPVSGEQSTASANDAHADSGSGGPSTSLDRLSAASEPILKHAPAPSIQPDDSTPNAAVVVSVIEQSRNLAPPVLTSLMHQVADPIVAAGHAITAAGGNLAPTGDVKTLEIQLVPENLGAVTVKMRLAGDALEVQVEADRQGTLRLLTDNKDALSQSIEASGYKLDAMTLQASSSSNASGFDGGQASQGQAQGHNSGFQSSSQGSGSSPGSSQQGQDRTRDQAHFGRSREGRSGETSDGYGQDNDRDRRSRSLYV